MNTTTAIATQAQPLPPALLMDEGELMEVLETSLYRGAKRSSIKMVISYCRAQRLDPLQKPVHIVPVNTKVPANQPGAKDRWEWVDSVWPGINLYRTNASRSGRHAGTSEPEFGPTITRKFHIPPKEGNGPGREVEVSYPEWCRVIVRRVLDNGTVAEFVGYEFWVENYATVGNYSDAPNAMWTKRPHGQLAKCTEAQALRKAFPESCGGPTAEEMEGKTLDETGNPIRPADVNAVSDELLKEWMDKARKAETDADAVKVYNDGLAVLRKDITAAAEFKRTVLERRRALQKNAGASDAQVKTVDKQQPDPQRGEESQEAPAGSNEGYGDDPANPGQAERQITLAALLGDMVQALKQKNPVALDVAADWIPELPEEHRAEATAKYEEYKKELSEGAAK